MILLLLIVAVLVFVAITVLVMGTVGESQAVRVAERIERVQHSQAVVRGTMLGDALQKSLWERIVTPFLNKMRQRIVEITPEGMVRSAQQKLERAGNAPHLSLSSFLVTRVVAMVGGIAAAIWIAMTWDLSPMAKLAVCLIVVLIGMLGPDTVLDGKIKARQTAIQKSLPDIIDLLVVSTEAGAGLDGALATVVERKKGPLVEEFERLLTEIRLGKSRAEAWSDMAERVDIADLNMLVASLQQAEQLGVSIANTLRTQAQALRKRRSMAVRQVAATLGLKMLFPLIFCILPAMFVVVLGPGLMSLSSSFNSLGW